MKRTVLKMKLTNFGRNHGIALPTILILLLVMTILGVTSLSSSTLQERMTSSQKFREIAFNAAESTLRAGEEEALRIAGMIREQTLTSESGQPFTFFGITTPAAEIAVSNDFWVLGHLPMAVDNPGDECMGGYCIPAEHDTTTVANPVERWLDPDVWEDPERHRLLGQELVDQFAAQGVANAPQYIIEYLGQLPDRTTPNDPNSATTNCTSTPGGTNGLYPYCKLDEHFFRITARAIAGLGGRESAVMLQSTVKVP